MERKKFKQYLGGEGNREFGREGEVKRVDVK
jgi:hypothetical protein